jgi:uncharacterized protein (TIGR00730 family)
MSKINSICVYCGSSNTISQRYKDLASDLGHQLAEQDITLVFGGGGVGLMGIISDACLKAGGRAIGVMTEFLFEYEGTKREITELHVVKSMHERKCKMFDLSDGFIIMPGGFGTLDEAFEILTWRQVGLHSKGIVLLNTFSYWDGLVNVLIPHMIQEGFVRPEDRNAYDLCETPKDAIDALRQVHSGNGSFISKWG